MAHIGNNVNNETFSVYTGPWINWQEGFIFGSQVTLSNRNSQLLSSFLSLFVGFVGVQLWQIISYVVHQLRSTNGPSDALHQQTQIILRNATSPWSAAKGFLDILWSWRKHADNFFVRSLPWALLAAVYAVAFGLLSIFAANEISKAPGSGRLIRGENCGFYDTSATDLLSNQIWQQGETLNAASAAQYAASCYPGNSSTTSVVQCDVFQKPFIDFEQSQTSLCPFQGICNMNNTSPLVMDTGLVDSSLVLGMNTPENQRLQYRKIATCTPINATGLTTSINITSDDSEFPSQPGDTIVTYNFGPIQDSSNYTFFHNRHAGLDRIGYTIDAEWAYAHSGPLIAWDPIPAFNRTDADVMFAAISGNAMRVEATCEDAIFGAHLLDSEVIDENEVFNSYFLDRIVGTIACTEQYQICNPNNDKCTTLSGHFDLMDSTLDLTLNNMQVMIAERITKALAYSDLYKVINGRGAAVLQAQNSVNGFIQAPLPPNQWQIESASWFASSLARFQSEIQQFVARASSGNLTLPNTDTLHRMAEYQCKNQLTQYTKGTTSYSLFGLGMTLCLGVVVILLSYLIEPIISLLQRGLFKHHIHKYRDWVLDEKLQLHRMALEARGVGPWYNTSNKVPVTDRGVLFTGWQAVDAEDGSYERVGMSPTQHNLPEIINTPESKPFISYGHSDTAYHGVNGPQLRVQEY